VPAPLALDEDAAVGVGVPADEAISVGELVIDAAMERDTLTAGVTVTVSDDETLCVMVAEGNGALPLIDAEAAAVGVLVMAGEKVTALLVVGLRLLVAVTLASLDEDAVSVMDAEADAVLASEPDVLQVAVPDTVGPALVVAVPELVLETELV
jgi:hypothetical protein